MYHEIGKSEKMTFALSVTKNGLLSKRQEMAFLAYLLLYIKIYYLKKTA